jgi:hypothetical protein
MKNNLKFISLGILLTAALTSCTSDDFQVEPNPYHSVRISNDGKQFEYWLGSEHHNSNGATASLTVKEGTQITMAAVVRVVDGVPIIPNIKLYQDDKLATIKQVTQGFFWYEVKQ